jgi:hypothetical protein
MLGWQPSWDAAYAVDWEYVWMHERRDGMHYLTSWMQRLCRFISFGDVTTKQCCQSHSYLYNDLDALISLSLALNILFARQPKEYNARFQSVV